MLMCVNLKITASMIANLSNPPGGVALDISESRRNLMWD